MLKESINVCLMKNWSAIPVPLNYASQFSIAKHGKLRCSLVSCHYIIQFALPVKIPTSPELSWNYKTLTWFITYTRNGGTMSPSERYLQSWCQEPPYSQKLQINFPRLIRNQSKWFKWCQGKHPKPKVTTTNHLPWNGVVKRIPWVQIWPNTSFEGGKWRVS